MNHVSKTLYLPGQTLIGPKDQILEPFGHFCMESSQGPAVIFNSVVHITKGVW